MLGLTFPVLIHAEEFATQRVWYKDTDGNQKSQLRGGTNPRVILQNNWPILSTRIILGNYRSTFPVKV